MATLTGVSQSTVARLHRQHRDTLGSIQPGRPRTLTERQERLIARSAASGSVLTAVEAQTSLQASSLADVSVQTVRRALERSGLHARIRPKKPLLRPRHRSQRLAFARKYQNWTVEDWRRVVWSDETKVCLLGSSGRSYCWRRSGGPLLEHHILPTLKHGGGSILAWGCMTARGLGYLVRLPEGLDAPLYVNILQEQLLGTLEWYGLETGEVVFQHDNDPKHKAKITMDWLLDSGLSVLDWPSQSPDLNPIEHLWAELKRRLHSREEAPGSVEDLWLAMEEEWNGIGADFCVRLIDTMPQRVAAVLQARGGNTSW